MSSQRPLGQFPLLAAQVTCAVEEGRGPALPAQPCKPPSLGRPPGLDAKRAQQVRFRLNSICRRPYWACRVKDWKEWKA